jgi:hypothetical protein
VARKIKRVRRREEYDSGLEKTLVTNRLKWVVAYKEADATDLIG